MSKIESPLKDRGKSYLTIISLLREGLTAQQVSSSLGVPKTTLSYHLNKLKLLDVIYKVSYGVWGVKEENINRIHDPQKRVLKGGKDVRKNDPCRYSRRGGLKDKDFVLVRDGSSNKIVQDSVATHGLMFVVRLPNLARWSKHGRRAYLESQKISFRSVPQGEALDVLGWKVHLTSKSLVAYAPRGVRWYGATADDGYRSCFSEFLRVLKRVEKRLNVHLGWSGRYKVRCTREHHALVGNALAEQYTRSGEKLWVSDDRGVWALIDASVRPGEFETVRPGVVGRDANRRVQDFFNGVKSTGVTPQKLLQMIHGLAENAEHFGEHMRTHVEVMSEIRDFIREFREMKK